MSPIIAPSILAADLANLQRDIEMINKSEADWIHVDVMDGMFVPNISLGIPVIKAIKRYAEKPLDVHLMIQQPERYLETFKAAGADVITVHIEACPHLHRTVHQIKQLGCKAGVALNPHTSIEALEDIVTDVDLVCVMSVNPGFGGQKFIGRTYYKVHKLRELIDKEGSKALIEVDGGVDGNNSAELLKSGADVLVAGSYVFDHENPLEAIAGLKKIIKF
ncbi:MAG: ribulose-phosphate 3-epimerase [Flammeovirgaceae bacterium]